MCAEASYQIVENRILGRGATSSKDHDLFEGRRDDFVNSLRELDDQYVCDLINALSGHENVADRALEQSLALLAKEPDPRFFSAGALTDQKMAEPSVARILSSLMRRSDAQKEGGVRDWMFFSAMAYATAGYWEHLSYQRNAVSALAPLLLSTQQIVCCQNLTHEPVS